MYKRQLESNLPWFPIGVGLAIGALAVGMDIVGQKRGVQLPSMALAVGIYLPAYLGVGILIGSLFRYFGERGSKRQSGESILAAAGLVTGAALLELLLGIAIVGANTEAYEFDLSMLHAVDLPDWAANAAGVAGILALGILLWSNSRPKQKS